MEIAIEKLVYGGDGLGRLPQGKAAFVPFVLEGERVEVALTEERSGFERGKLVSIAEPSLRRVLPPCPYFAACGGCHYQHTSYEHQLEIKSAIFKETLRRTAKLTLDVPLEEHSGEPWQYRNRTRMKVRTAPDFALGYHRHQSHELLPVEECPISSPLINRALSTVWEVGKESKCRGLREVQFFANHDDTKLLLELHVERGVDPEGLHAFAEATSKALPNILGVAIFAAVPDVDDEAPQLPLQGAQIVVVGSDSLVYKAAGEEYSVRAGSFFQTNRFLVETLVTLVTDGRSGNAALDLYAGTGLFTVPLSRQFRQVTSVESAPASFADLRENAGKSVKTVQATTENFLARKGALTEFDLVVVDPPRAGLGEKVCRALGRMNTPRVTYVSCDPATLSRDVRMLLESGFHIESAHLVDLFPQTYHMESVLQLVR